MGLDTFIVGFISDETDIYKKHAAVLIACIAAGIKELPTETAEFFGSKYPSTSLFEEVLQVKIPYKQSSKDTNDFFEILVSDIPKHVHKIRFTNSY